MKTPIHITVDEDSDDESWSEFSSETDSDTENSEIAHKP